LKILITGSRWISISEELINQYLVLMNWQHADIIYEYNEGVGYYVQQYIKSFNMKGLTYVEQDEYYKHLGMYSVRRFKYMMDDGIDGVLLFWDGKEKKFSVLKKLLDNDQIPLIEVNLPRNLSPWADKLKFIT